MNTYKVILTSQFKSEINETFCSNLIDYVEASSLTEAFQLASKLTAEINSNNDIMYRVELVERELSECGCCHGDKIID